MMRKSALVLMIVICGLMFYTGCGEDDDGGGPGSSTPTPTASPPPGGGVPPGSPMGCVPNDDLPSSMCLAEDLLIACIPYLCEVQFSSGPVIGFIFPDNLHLGHTFGECSASPECTAVINCEDPENPGQDAGIHFTDLRIQDGILQGTVVRESDSAEATLMNCRLDPNSI